MLIPPLATEVLADFWHAVVSLNLPGAAVGALATFVAMSGNQRHKDAADARSRAYDRLRAEQRSVLGDLEGTDSAVATLVGVLGAVGRPSPLRQKTSPTYYSVNGTSAHRVARQLADRAPDSPLHDVLAGHHQQAADLYAEAAKIETDGPEDVASASRLMERAEQWLEQTERVRASVDTYYAERLRPFMPDERGWLERLRDAARAPLSTMWKRR